VQRAAQVYSEFQALAAQRAERADRIYAWFGRALDLVMVVGFIGLTATAYAEFGENDQYEQYEFLWAVMIIMSLTAIRIARLSGWHAFPQVKWSTNKQPRLTPSALALKLIPLHLSGVLLLWWTNSNGVNIANNADERFVFFWFAISALATVFLQSLRSEANDAWLKFLLRDFWIASNIIVVPFLLMLFIQDSFIYAAFVPAGLILLVGLGYRWHAVALIVMAIVLLIISTGGPDYLWPNQMDQDALIAVPLWTGIHTLAFWAVLSIRIKPRVATPNSPSTPFEKSDLERIPE
jgi:hypothetical protein